MSLLHADLPERPIIFFQLTALTQFTRVLGPAICGGLMRLSPWYPILCGMVLLLISSVLSFTVPETLQKADMDDMDIVSYQPGQTSILGRLKGAGSTYVQSLRELGPIGVSFSSRYSTHSE